MPAIAGVLKIPPVARSLRLAGVVTVAMGGLAAAPGRAADPKPLAAARAEVEAALRAEATAVGFDAWSAAVHRLVTAHDGVAKDPEIAATAAAAGLRRRLAARLAVVGRKLRPLAEAAPPESALPRGRHPPSAAVWADGGGGRQADARVLIELIQATVRPEVWEVHGGPCTMFYFPHGQGLVVRATQEVHEDLGRLLRQLR